MDFTKALILIFAAIIMIVCIVFVPESAGAVSLTFLGVLSLYIGLDVAGMILATSKLKAGQFKRLKTHKYIVSGLCLTACIIVCVIKWSNVLSGTMTTLLSAVMVILSCAIGGLEGNKIATQIDGSASTGRVET